MMPTMDIYSCGLACPCGKHACQVVGEHRKLDGIAGYEYHGHAASNTHAYVWSASLGNNCYEWSTNREAPERYGKLTGLPWPPAQPETQPDRAEIEMPEFVVGQRYEIGKLPVGAIVRSQDPDGQDYAYDFEVLPGHAGSRAVRLLVALPPADKSEPALEPVAVPEPTEDPMVRRVSGFGMTLELPSDEACERSAAQRWTDRVKRDAWANGYGCHAPSDGHALFVPLDERIAACLYEREADEEIRAVVDRVKRQPKRAPAGLVGCVRGNWWSP